MDGILTLQQKRLLRVDEAARILNVSRWTIYRWVDAGRLGGTRLGAGSLRIFSHTVAALIDSHCVGADHASTAEAEEESPPEAHLLVGGQETGVGRRRVRQHAAL